VQQLLGLIDRTTLADNGAYWVIALLHMQCVSMLLCMRACS
jgi:hypothetical protein